MAILQSTSIPYTNKCNIWELQLLYHVCIQKTFVECLEHSVYRATVDAVSNVEIRKASSLASGPIQSQ